MGFGTLTVIVETIAGISLVIRWVLKSPLDRWAIHHPFSHFFGGRPIMSCFRSRRLLITTRRKSIFAFLTSPGWLFLFVNPFTQAEIGGRVAHIREPLGRIVSFYLTFCPRVESKLTGTDWRDVWRPTPNAGIKFARLLDAYGCHSRKEKWRNFHRECLVVLAFKCWTMYMRKSLLGFGKMAVFSAIV